MKLLLKQLLGAALLLLVPMNAWAGERQFMFDRVFSVAGFSQVLSVLLFLLVFSLFVRSYFRGNSRDGGLLRHVKSSSGEGALRVVDRLQLSSDAEVLLVGVGSEQKLLVSRSAHGVSVLATIERIESESVERGPEKIVHALG